MEQNLHELAIEQLEQLIQETQVELQARDRKQKQHAELQIRAIAESAGLLVTVKEKGQKKRGRPRKNAISGAGTVS